MNKLYTHNDLDGVSCAILAKLAYKDDIDIEYCSNPAEVSTKLSNNTKQYDKIFVTDCSFDCDIPSDNIYVFDHHHTAINLLTKIKHADIREYYNNRLTCGTELFYQYLIKCNLIHNIDFFVEQVRLYDTWDWTKSTSKLPKYLNMLMYMLSADTFVSIFTERLAKQDVNELTIFNQHERDLLTYEVIRQQQDIEKSLAHITTIKTSKYTLGIIVGDYNMSSLGNAMCERYNIDIAVGINLMQGIVSVRTQRDDIDLGKLMKATGNGGGHAKSAGCLLDLDLNKIYNNIIGDIFGEIIA